MDDIFNLPKFWNGDAEWRIHRLPGRFEAEFMDKPLPQPAKSGD